MKRGTSLGNFLAHYHPLSKEEVKFVGGGDHGFCETLIGRPNTPRHQRRMRRIASLVQKWPGKEKSPSRPIKSTIAAGISGWNSSTGFTTPTSLILRSLSTRVQGGTARQAIEKVVAAFVESGRDSPILNSKGKTHIHIDRPSKGLQERRPHHQARKRTPSNNGVQAQTKDGNHTA